MQLSPYRWICIFQSKSSPKCCYVTEYSSRYCTKSNLGQVCFYNPLPNDKISDMTKLKAFGDNKLNISKMAISLFDKVENNVGK